ncbi:MAG: ABC transporter permease [Aggregatilineales bacterium]
MSATGAVRPTRRQVNRFTLRSEQVRELGLLLIIAAIVVFFGSQVTNFLTATTFQRIADSVMIIAVVSVGQTLVVITRNIDLSVGSVVGLTAFVVGKQFAGNPNLSPVLAIGLSLGIGAVAGLINGVIVSYGRVPSIVATLGTLAMFRGALFQYANSSNIATRQLPDWLVNLPGQTLVSIGSLNISVMAGLALAVVIVFQLALIYLPAGRRLYAIGSDPDTAVMSGISRRRLVLLAHVVCGILAGLGGFMYLAKFGTIQSTAGQGLELQTVAAVVLGGVNIFGGSGRVIGALLGAILVGTLEYGLIRTQIGEFAKQAIEGAAILLAIAGDGIVLARVRDRMAKRQGRVEVVKA